MKNKDRVKLLKESRDKIIELEKAKVEVAKRLKQEKENYESIMNGLMNHMLMELEDEQ